MQDMQIAEKSLNKHFSTLLASERENLFSYTNIGGKISMNKHAMVKVKQYPLKHNLHFFS